jgi:hypothetical protein
MDGVVFVDGFLQRSRKNGGTVVGTVFPIPVER